MQRVNAANNNESEEARQAQRLQEIRNRFRPLHDVTSLMAKTGAAVVAASSATLAYQSTQANQVVSKGLELLEKNINPSNDNESLESSKSLESASPSTDIQTAKTTTVVTKVDPSTHDLVLTDQNGNKYEEHIVDHSPQVEMHKNQLDADLKKQQQDQLHEENKLKEQNRHSEKQNDQTLEAQKQKQNASTNVLLGGVTLMFGAAAIEAGLSALELNQANREIALETQRQTDERSEINRIDQEMTTVETDLRSYMNSGNITAAGLQNHLEEIQVIIEVLNESTNTGARLRARRLLRIVNGRMNTLEENSAAAEQARAQATAAELERNAAIEDIRQRIADLAQNEIANPIRIANTAGLDQAIAAYNIRFPQNPLPAAVIADRQGLQQLWGAPNPANNRHGNVFF